MRVRGGTSRGRYREGIAGDRVRSRPPGASVRSGEGGREERGSSGGSGTERETQGEERTRLRLRSHMFKVSLPCDQNFPKPSGKFRVYTLQLVNSFF